MRQSVVSSGGFVETKDGTVGVLAVHIADQRHHRPPGGWKLSTSFIDQDYEVFIYERTT
jgi:hypothetical protein